MEEVVNNDEGASTVTLQARKRKTSKQVRNEEPKPKVRSKTRAHQNWNERYLTNKKKVDTLQPDHNLPRDFIYAVRNNMHDPKVRGAAKTAGKLINLYSALGPYQQKMHLLRSVFFKSSRKNVVFNLIVLCGFVSDFSTFKLS